MENKSTLLSADFTILDQCFELLGQGKEESDIDQIKTILESAGRKVEKDGVFYGLMRYYVDTAHKESNNISNIEESEIASNNESIASTQKTKKSKRSNLPIFLNKKNIEEVSDKNSIITSKKEEIIGLQDDYQSQSKKLKDEYNQHKDKYNNAIISFCEKEANKPHLDYFKNGDNPLLWYVMVNNGGSFFRDDTILKIIEKTSDKNLTTKIKAYSLLDYAIEQNIGGNRDLSGIINSLLNRGVVVNYDNSDVLYNLLNSNRMKSSNITSTLLPEMIEKCINEVTQEGDLKLFYLFRNSKNIASEAKNSVTKEITIFIDHCNDGELLNEIFCSALKHQNSKSGQDNQDPVFNSIYKKENFNKIKINSESLCEIINSRNTTMLQAAIQNVKKQIKSECQGNSSLEQLKISEFLEQRYIGDTIFTLACKTSDDAVKELIELDRSCINHKDNLNRSVLEIAVDKYFSKTGEILVNNGAEITNKAFISAVTGNQETMTKLLLKNGANPNCYNIVEIPYQEQEVEIKLDSFKEEELGLENNKISLMPTKQFIRESVLEIAIKNNNFQIVSSLVGSGATIRDQNNNYLELYSNYKKSLQPNERQELAQQEFEAFSTYIGKTVVDIDRRILDIKSSISNPSKNQKLVLQGMESLREDFFSSVVKNSNTSIDSSLKKIDSIKAEIFCGNTLLKINTELTFSKKDLDLLKQGHFSETSILKPTNTPQPNKLSSSIVNNKFSLFK